MSTWLPGPIAGVFFYLYLIVDIFSRKIVGWEVYGRESAEYASMSCAAPSGPKAASTSPLVLHADNGSPMKGATLKVTLEHLGVTASYSRPRVSNDNPFSEALFRTCKYRPEWPSKGFNDIEAARGWVARCRPLISLPGPLFSPGLEHRPPHDGGAAWALEDGKPPGRGYLELTGYVWFSWNPRHDTDPGVCQRSCPASSCCVSCSEGAGVALGV